MSTASPSRTRLGHESFVVRDVHCAHCAGTLQSVVRTLPGVVAAGVESITGWTSIDFEPEVVSGEELRRAVEAAGYRIVEHWSN